MFSAVGIENAVCLHSNADFDVKNSALFMLKSGLWNKIRYSCVSMSTIIFVLLQNYRKEKKQKLINLGRRRINVEGISHSVETECSAPSCREPPCDHVDRIIRLGWAGSVLTSAEILDLWASLFPHL